MYCFCSSAVSVKNGGEHTATFRYITSVCLLVQDLTALEVHADHLFLLGTYADDEINAIDFGNGFESVDELWQITQTYISMLQDAVDENRLDIMI